MEIRYSREADLPALRELFNASRKAAFFWEEPSQYQMWDFDEVTRDEVVFVAESNEEIVGFVGIYLPDDFIHSLYVAPEFFNQGIGHSLLDRALQELPKTAQLKVVSKNKRALEFYQKNNWLKISEDTTVDEPYWLMEYRK
ncbi:MAG: GNAT family N-acetyltransferase [Enterococcus sp.]